MLVFTPLFAVAIIIFWRLFQNHLARSAQPLRLRLADQGETLLARDDLPNEVRKDVEFMLETAFSRWGMVLFAIVVVPVAAVYVVFSPRAQAAFERDYRNLAPEARALYADVRGLHNRIILANHPLLTSIVALEVAVLMAPLSLLMLAIRSDPTSAPLDRYAFINIVEMQEHTLMSKLRRREGAATC